VNIRITRDFGLVLECVPQWLLAMLGEMPRVPERCGWDPAFQDPTGGQSGGEAETLREDWRSLIVPELAEAFRGEFSVYVSDLAAAEACETSPEDGADFEPSAETGPLFRVLVPPAHVEPWFGALNQARLAIEFRCGFGNRRVSARQAAGWDAETIELYQLMWLAATLQEPLLMCLEHQFGGPPADTQSA
jgi:hypothetical protein